MAVENKKVKRDEKTTRAELMNALIVRQLGVESGEYYIGYKDKNGNEHWYAPENSDALFNSLQLAGLAGNGANFIRFGAVFRADKICVADIELSAVSGKGIGKDFLEVGGNIDWTQVIVVGQFGLHPFVGHMQRYRRYNPVGGVGIFQVLL